MPANQNTRWALKDFAKILGLEPASGRKWTIVGGQAVNFWASHYLRREPELAAFEPFTSKDLDLVGDHKDVEALAKRSGTKPTIPRRSAASPIVAIFKFETPLGALTVEVLNGLAHLTPAQVEAQAIALESITENPRVSVLNPIACLIDKIGNLARFEQTDRQDLRHVQILIHCTRAFLHEAVHDAMRGGVEPRQCVKLLEQVLSITRSSAAASAAQKYDIRWTGLWPYDALCEAKVEQIQRFVEHRLPKRPD